MSRISLSLFFFFFNDTATTEIYTLSLHDALPISFWASKWSPSNPSGTSGSKRSQSDRKSTRLNSSHHGISYAVFCLKKKRIGLDYGAQRGTRAFYLVDAREIRLSDLPRCALARSHPRPALSAPRARALE